MYSYIYIYLYTYIYIYSLTNISKFSGKPSPPRHARVAGLPVTEIGLQPGGGRRDRRSAGKSGDKFGAIFGSENQVPGLVNVQKTMENHNF